MQQRGKVYEEIDISQIEDITCFTIKGIGNKIKQLRENSNLTQQHLSFLMYSDKSLISNLERGVCKNITLFTLIKIAKVFDISLELLLK